MQWEREDWPREVGDEVMALMPFRDTIVREAIHGLKYHGLYDLAGLLVERGSGWCGASGSFWRSAIYVNSGAD